MATIKEQQPATQPAVYGRGVFVLPDQVEEEAKIISVETYKVTIPRMILFVILTIGTCGALLLICKWKNTLATLILGARVSSADATRLLVSGADKSVEPCSIESKNLCLDGTVKSYRAFMYRHYTYYYDVHEKVFRPVQFEIKNMNFGQVIEEFGSGVTSTKLYNERLMTYGPNSTDIERKNIFEVVIDEISSPLYIFQAFAIVFWAVWNDYFMYAMIILGISLFSVIVGVVRTVISLNKLYKRAHYEVEMTVVRSENGDKTVTKVVSSCTLVPGDLVEVPFNKKMPCDIVLLTGTCVMNESMLTGEAIPVIKQHISKSEKLFDARNIDQYLLYSGTECLEARRSDKAVPVLGFVVRSGFDTMKGRLVRSFLYSKPENFKFYRDALKYLFVMFLIAIIAFLVAIPTYIDDETIFGDYVVHLLEIITCAVPPALPTCLAVGTAMSAARLEKQKILAKNDQKILISGRVKVMCFDKTGTLTRDNLDLFGVRPASKSAQFENLVSGSVHATFNDGAEKSSNQKMLELMATCHTLTYVRGVISGDPLDLKMFESTQWGLKEIDGTAGQATCQCTLHPPTTTGSGYFKPNTTIEVIKRFEFVAKLQRMSAIVKDPQENKLRVYVKGSPEVLSTICRPDTIPADFTQTLLSYTKSGLRVIACATRTVQENITVDSQDERDKFENNLEFLGFLVFENKLKEVTPSVISKLKAADIDTMMLTGDNPLTAIFVARDCAIVEKNNKVILGAMEASGSDQTDKKLIWRVIEETVVQNGGDTPGTKTKSVKQIGVEITSPVAETKQILSPKPVAPQNPSGDLSLAELENILQTDNNVAIALTGEATNYIVAGNGITFGLRKLIFKKSKVFARMKPDDKAFIVDSLQHQGNIVGMCGDGANDCPALKVANVGIALSEAEASLAAPFMSRVIDISAVDTVLREGRAALVTNFQCFKYMSIYALIQTFNIAILNVRGSGMTNGTFLYEDLFVVLPLCLTMGMTGPTSKLSKKRPTENLLSAAILISMFGQVLIQVGAQVLGAFIVSETSWYQNPTEIFEEAFPDGGDDDSWISDWDLTVVFLVAAFQFFSTVMAFSIGKPFRKPFYTNYLFCFVLFYTTVTTLILILIPIPDLIDLVGLYDFTDHQYFRWIILAIVLVNALITLLYERFGVPALISLGKKVFKIKNKEKKLNN